MKTPAVERPRAWFLLMHRTSLALALGSFLLLVGFLSWLGFRSVLLFSMFGLLATWVHYAAWILLAVALWTLRGEGHRALSPLDWAMVAAFAGSVLAFAVIWVALPHRFFFGTPLLPGPYFPSVYGPVVAAHGAFFFLGWRTLRNRRTYEPIVIGSLFLLAVAAGALAVQAMDGPPFSGFPGVVATSLAGLTGFGYILIAASWRREARVGPVRRLMTDSSSTQSHPR